MTDGEPTKFDEWTLLEVEWDCITRRAKARFLDQWDEREDWKNFEARYHVYKAHDQLSVASYHTRQDDADELVKTNIADAMNHMLMAMATLDVNRDECQPVTEQDIVDRGDGIETDGGEDQFSVRVGEMVREIEEDVEDSTKAEAMLYARCSAAFEDAVNNTDLPAENALGVMTAALFEAADTVGYARSDVIETAREHHVDEDDVDRGDGPVTDGGQPAAGTGGGRHAPAMRGSTTEERTYAHFCDEAGTTIYSPRRKCPLGCYKDDDIVTDGGVTTYECDECGDVERCNVDDAGARRCPDCGRAVTAIVTDGGLLTGGGRYHVVCSDCTFEDLKRERHQAARAVDDHRTDEPSHDVRFEEVRGR